MSASIACHPGRQLSPFFSGSGSNNSRARRWTSALTIWWMTLTTNHFFVKVSKDKQKFETCDWNNFDTSDLLTCLKDLTGTFLAKYQSLWLSASYEMLLAISCWIILPTSVLNYLEPCQGTCSVCAYRFTASLASLQLAVFDKKNSKDPKERHAMIIHMIFVQPWTNRHPTSRILHLLDMCKFCDRFQLALWM